MEQETTYPADRTYTVNTVLLMNLIGGFVKPADWDIIGPEKQMSILETYIQECIGGNEYR